MSTSNWLMLAGQAGNAAPSGGGELTPMLLMMAALFLLFYFIILRPQKREQQRLELGEPIGVGRILAWLASDDADYVRGMIQTR